MNGMEWNGIIIMGSNGIIIINGIKWNHRMDANGIIVEWNRMESSNGIEWNDYRMESNEMEWNGIEWNDDRMESNGNISEWNKMKSRIE